MNFQGNQEPFKSGLAPAITGRAHDNAFTIEHPYTADARAVKNIMDQNRPEARYATYYYAMNFLFLPNTSLVARHVDGRVIGGIVSMYDFEFKRLIISHVASSLALAPDQAATVKRQLIGQAFENAAGRGIQEISANLDISPDPLIMETFNAHHSLPGALSFNTAGNSFAPAASLGRAQAGILNQSDVVYRHPVETDAHALWSLVLKINKESGGLDIYALSNYQRLCRDFSQTCMVAELGGHIIGFATGFMMPNDIGKTGLFLWQTGVHPNYHGQGIGSQVERYLIDAHRPDYLHFTVEASNNAANRTAEKKAAYMRTAFAKIGAITSEHLGDGHEAEFIYFVGEPPHILKL